MDEHITIEMKAYRSVFLWFIPFEQNDAEVLASGGDADNPMGTFTHSFDYEKIAKNKWKMHMDAGMQVVPVAAISTRTSFEVPCTKEQLFLPELLDPMLQRAFKTCLRSFNEQCKEHGLPADWNIGLTATHTQDFINGMVKQYRIRKKDDAANRNMETPGLSLTQGRLTLLGVKAVFMIMDEILFLNKGFDRKHNLQAFSEVMAETLYYTLKLNCIELESRNIQLSWRYTVFYAICLDCAMQMLLGEHDAKLIPPLEEKGLSQEKREQFIRYGEGLLKNMRKSLKHSGTTITNLQKRYDWNALIK